MKRPKVFHLFSGCGGGALGFQRADFDTLGGIDSSEAACRDFELLTGVRATVGDLMALTPADVRRAAGGRRPDVVFTSPPCKGFSGCLPAERSRSGRYVAMNSLALRGVWLALEAWKKPPALLVFENVPRIAVRGAEWLRQIEGLLQGYGYAVAMTTHDCGELGGLAQRRKRFLLVARHMEQVPAFLRVPPHKRVRGVGEVLDELPVPGRDEGGDMHQLSKLAPINWLRLALIPAGGDWRDLPESVALPARGGRQNGGFGVNAWDHPSHAVVAEGSVRNTWSSVQDPRLGCRPRAGVLGVVPWDRALGTVIGQARPDNGAFAVADPRSECQRREGSLGVTAWDHPSTAIIAHGTLHNGPWQVADPRDAWIDRAEHDVDWASKRPIHMMILAEDGTWHRPLTTLELAALQGFPTRHAGRWLHLTGRSHKQWRERIGNAVPPPAARAIAGSCAATLAVSAAAGFELSTAPIWVRERLQHAVRVF